MVSQVTSVSVSESESEIFIMLTSESNDSLSCTWVCEQSVKCLGVCLLYAYDKIKIVWNHKLIQFCTTNNTEKQPKHVLKDPLQSYCSPFQKRLGYQWTR